MGISSRFACPPRYLSPVLKEIRDIIPVSSGSPLLYVYTTATNGTNDCIPEIDLFLQEMSTPIQWVIDDICIVIPGWNKIGIKHGKKAGKCYSKENNHQEWLTLNDST